MPSRKYSATDSYRYGFNGKENDNEVKGEGNQQDYGMRIYDPRLGRFLSVDPLTSEYPWYTPFQFAGNKPIWATDIDGAEEKPTNEGSTEGQMETTSKTSFHSYAAARGGRYETKTQTWYYHKGGLLIKYGKDIGRTTVAGWYSATEYAKIVTPMAEEFASYQGLWCAWCGNRKNWKEEQKSNVETTALGKFLDKGITENAEKILIARAYELAQSARDRGTGRIDYSSFNVEDIIGLGLIFKAATKAVGNIVAKNLSKKGIDLLRETLSIGKSKNIATLGGEIDNISFYTIGVSGETSRSGTVGIPALRRFTTREIGGYDRLFDSEVKVLEDFANKFHNTPNIKGTLTLTSEREFCGSCSGVIEQFQKMFPNIKLHTVNGVK